MLWTKFVVCALVFIGCKSQSISTQNTSMGEQAFEVLLTDSYGNYTVQEFIAIKDSNTLQSVYSVINDTRKPGFTIPTIDFNKEVVLFLTLGQKNVGGFSIAVHSVVQTDTEMIVYYTQTSPKPTDMVTSVITMPFTIVKTAATQLPIKFEAISQ